MVHLPRELRGRLRLLQVGPRPGGEEQQPQLRWVPRSASLCWHPRGTARLRDQGGSYRASLGAPGGSAQPCRGPWQTCCLSPPQPAVTAPPWRGCRSCSSHSRAAWLRGTRWCWSAEPSATRRRSTSGSGTGVPWRVHGRPGSRYRGAPRLVQHGTAWHGAVRHGTVRCRMARHSVVQHSVVWCSMAQRGVVAPAPLSIPPAGAAGDDGRAGQLLLPRVQPLPRGVEPGGGRGDR